MARLIIAGGSFFYGRGFGASGVFVGELCFATAMSGYQEILTDPSYHQQILCFSFPHIGNTGINSLDSESLNFGVGGAITSEFPTVEPTHHQSSLSLEGFAQKRGIIGISGVDTRGLVQEIRRLGEARAIIENGTTFSDAELKQNLEAWEGLTGKDLSLQVTCTRPYTFSQGQHKRVVVVDYGVKKSILTALADLGLTVIVVPANASFSEVMAHKPDGVLLSNGPGDPRATLEYTRPMIQELLEARIPTFGICLGHQLLALALGGRVERMQTGHRGVNHPIRSVLDGRVMVTTMNHGYTVDARSLPPSAQETHVSLFDGTNGGFILKDRPVMAVQFHPEACAGTKDARVLFDKFYELMV